jgi:predicted transcriptional regulator of viral defense system
VFIYEGFQLALLSGKHTNNLEVLVQNEGPFSGLRVTSLERTLIDIAVRPDYSGGIAQVADAFERSRDRVSAPRLIATLDELSYRYPYHQALGFYLERAGYPDRFLEPLRARKARHDFYLAHAMPEAKLDASWRVYRPEWL